MAIITPPVGLNPFGLQAARRSGLLDKVMLGVIPLRSHHADHRLRADRLPRHRPLAAGRLELARTYLEDIALSLDRDLREASCP